MILSFACGALGTRGGASRAGDAAGVATSGFEEGLPDDLVPVATGFTPDFADGAAAFAGTGGVGFASFVAGAAAGFTAGSDGLATDLEVPLVVGECAGFGAGSADFVAMGFSLSGAGRVTFAADFGAVWALIREGDFGRGVAPDFAATRGAGGAFALDWVVFFATFAAEGAGRDNAFTRAPLSIDSQPRTPLRRAKSASAFNGWSFKRPAVLIDKPLPHAKAASVVGW